MDICPVPTYVEPLLVLARNLPHLTQITFPAFEGISEILDQLSGSTQLKTLAFHYYRGRVAVEQTGTRLRGNVFTHLVDLSCLVSNYTSIRPFVSNHCLTNLRILNLESHSNLGPNLTDLVLECPATDDLGSDIEEFPSRDELVTFDNFRTILACPKITSFMLSHPHPVKLSNSDIDEIALAWAQLQYIDLPSGPPRAACFGLLMDTKASAAMSDPSSLIPSFPNEMPNANLEEVEVGHSVIKVVDCTYDLALLLKPPLSILM
ncbi:hypothetical protein D9758_012946 [Tetrapyrgos nigripes]|uniref:Uncharacterized protein n=1 Tax=Tetrapyrgos nigripes TaxID=182062 RepID=A0A8H5FNP7_9AGAR|nr:hypothetical protein D9758_012946 [Tetrapyrgos nigripes]